MSAVAAAALPLASCTGECQKSGPIGLAVILVLCVACYFLFKSMSRHLRKVREQFPSGSKAKPPAAGGDTPARPRDDDHDAGGGIEAGPDGGGKGSGDSAGGDGSGAAQARQQAGSSGPGRPVEPDERPPPAG